MQLFCAADDAYDGCLFLEVDALRQGTTGASQLHDMAHGAIFGILGIVLAEKRTGEKKNGKDENFKLQLKFGRL